MSRPIAVLLALGIAAVIWASASIAWGATAGMSPAEEAVCEAGGGCHFVTLEWLRDAIGKAYAAGQAKGITGCLKSAS